MIVGTLDKFHYDIFLIAKEREFCNNYIHLLFKVI